MALIQANYFNELPDDMILNILSYLGGEKIEFANISLINKRFGKLQKAVLPIIAQHYWEHLVTHRLDFVLRKLYNRNNPTLNPCIDIKKLWCVLKPNNHFHIAAQNSNRKLKAESRPYSDVVFSYFGV